MTHPDGSPLTDAADSELWDLKNLASATGLRDWMYEQFATQVGANVAEVGAGIGTFSELLLTSGHVESLLLLEPEPACLAELQRRFADDHRVATSGEALPESSELAARAGTLDFVLCQNVLEHIPDDLAAVKAMADGLRPGGVLTVLVPAHPRLYGALDRIYGHERRYDKGRLRYLADAAGLDVLELKRFNSLGTFGWIATRWRAAPSLTPAKLRAYEALLPPFRAFERRWQPPFGLSLILQARRPS